MDYTKVGNTLTPLIQVERPYVTPSDTRVGGRRRTRKQPKTRRRNRIRGKKLNRRASTKRTTKHV